MFGLSRTMDLTEESKRICYKPSARPTHDVFRKIHPHKLLAILKVNKQIHHGALPYFYRSNRFSLRSTGDLFKCLTGLTPERRSYLRYVVFRWTGRSPFWSFTGSQDARRAFKILSTCQNLKKLSISIGKPWDRDRPHAPQTEAEISQWVYGIKLLIKIDNPNVFFTKGADQYPEIAAYVLEKLRKTKLKKAAKAKRPSTIGPSSMMTRAAEKALKQARKTKFQ